MKSMKELKEKSQHLGWLDLLKGILSFLALAGMTGLFIALVYWVFKSVIGGNC